MIYIAYDVIEHFDDEIDRGWPTPPEPFGGYLHPTSEPPLCAGQGILLRWLDGSVAYPVTIKSIEGTTLHVAQPQVT